MILLSVRLCLCLIGFAGLSACDSEVHPFMKDRPVTGIFMSQGDRIPEAQARVPLYVVVSLDGTATIWRADADDAVTISVGDIPSRLSSLGVVPRDRLILFAQHDLPAERMVELLEGLKQHGYYFVALVTPGGWVPPVPTEGAAGD